MITKILVFSLVAACISALTTMLDRDTVRSGDDSAQAQPCGESGGSCFAMAVQPRTSTDRFLAMLATH